MHEFIVLKGRRSLMSGSCETCAYLFYDEDMEDCICDAAIDEDDFIRLQEQSFKGCPYYRDADEYRIARKQ